MQRRTNSHWSRPIRAIFARRTGLRVAATAWLSLFSSAAQPIIMSDDFEAPGNGASIVLWPLQTSAVIRSGELFFGPANRYLNLSGGSTRALSGDWSMQLVGKVSTFRFDYYEPAVSSGDLIAGFSAGNSDINTAEAFARIALNAGAIRFAGAEGVTVLETGATTYPRERRLTFSLVLNHGATPQPFDHGCIEPKTLQVWCYNHAAAQSVHMMTLSVAASARQPVRVGFRTFSAQTGVIAYIDNVLLLGGPVVFTGTTAPFRFVHPSIHNTQQELERMKYRVNQQPGSAAGLGWNYLRAFSLASLNYHHVPTSNVVVMGSGTTPSETQYRNDAQAAHADALQWVVSGDTRYRDKAITIMNDWARVFTTLSPAEGTSALQLNLEAAWYAPVWVAAADIIRYYDRGVASWNPADIAQFDHMLDYLYGEASQAAYRENNWGASAALAMIAVGVYQENRSRFEAGVRTWRERMVGINGAVDSYNDDSINEVCRDTIHPQYTLQVWMQAAEIAWKQGVDLYGMTLNGGSAPQFALNLEYFAELFLGLRPHPCPSTFTGDYVGEQNHSGAYDIAHNHYLHRLGLTNLPHYAELVVKHWRPGGYDGHFPAWSTLTHGDVSADIPAVTNLVLWDRATGKATSPLMDGAVLNLRDLAHTNFSVVAEADGETDKVQFFANNVPVSSADLVPPFESAVPKPGNYFLEAVPRHAMPSGNIPGDPYTRFVNVIDLPRIWALRQIGNPAMPSWVSEKELAIHLAGSGAGVSSVYDQCGFVSAQIEGDVQITSRVTAAAPLEVTAQYGLMVREGNEAGDSNVSLLLHPAETNVVALQVRANQSGPTTILASAPVAGTTWLRLTRMGNTFAAYYSTDGIAWSMLGTSSVPMNTSVQAGLAVAGGAADTVATADFDQILIEPLTGNYSEWQDWVFTRRAMAIESSIEPGADPDGDGRSNFLEHLLGTDPLKADPSPWARAVGCSGGFVRLQFEERRNAADLGRIFLYSTNLTDWIPASPASNQIVQDFGSVVVRELLFPISVTRGFYKSEYE